HGSSMPATRNQSLKKALLRSHFVQMERLRIELRRELFDSRGVHEIRPGRESLTNIQIIQIQLSSGQSRFYCFVRCTHDFPVILSQRLFFAIWTSTSKLRKMSYGIQAHLQNNDSDRG